jgi:hypothetical protein
MLKKRQSPKRGGNVDYLKSGVGVLPASSSEILIPSCVLPISLTASARAFFLPLRKSSNLEGVTSVLSKIPIVDVMVYDPQKRVELYQT